MLNRLLIKSTGAAGSPSSSKAASPSKPQGVTKGTASKRGRKPKKVTADFASDDANGQQIAVKAEEQEGPVGFASDYDNGQQITVKVEEQDGPMATGASLMNDEFDGDGKSQHPADRHSANL